MYSFWNLDITKHLFQIPIALMLSRHHNIKIKKCWSKIHLHWPVALHTPFTGNSAMLAQNEKHNKTMQLWIISLACASVLGGWFYLEIYSLTIFFNSSFLKSMISKWVLQKIDFQKCPPFCFLYEVKWLNCIFLNKSKPQEHLPVPKKWSQVTWFLYYFCCFCESSCHRCIL